jgi:hypothetical protein
MADLLSEYMESSMPKEKVVETIEDFFKTEIANKHISFDYDNMKKGKRISLFVNEKWKYRIDVQQILLRDAFPNISMLVDTGGSTGSVRVGQNSPQRYVPIFLRPMGRSTRAIKNEKIFAEQINNYASNTNPIIVELKSNKSISAWKAKSLKVKNVTGCLSTGQLGEGNRNQKVPKADAVLVIKGGNPVPISIKAGNAEFWGGIESWFYPDGSNYYGGDSYIKAARDDPGIDLTPVEKAKGSVTHFHKGNGKTKTDAALLANQKLKEILVFGSDILGNGAIVKRSFRTNDFKLEDREDEGQVLVVECDGIVTTPGELDENVWVLFMNTGSVDDNKVAVGRGAQSEFRGIRVIGCTPGRVGLQVVKLQDVGRFNSKKLPQIKVI